MSESTPVYAGFWKRMAAWILDYIVLLLIIVILTVLMSLMKDSKMGLVVALFAYGLVPWLYFAFMESSPRQATVGKAVLGIRVTDLAGERVSFGRATGRYFGKILSGLILNIGFAMAGFTDRRQALHDKVADTLVVRNNFTAAEIADAPPEPTPSFFSAVGLGLLVILFGPFGLGIFAGIAIPAYQDYTIRAQVSDGLINAAPAKFAIAATLASGSDPSQIEDEEAFAINSSYVSSMDNYDGVLVITFGDQAAAGIANKSVELVPSAAGSNEIVWRCGYAVGPGGMQFVADPPGKYTTIPPKYLPQNCR